ncbi:FAR1 DNA binding domain, Zinc finger, SWIM-type, MULE transposase domain, FHY3/FAR1 family [Artemisia annua]|nr:FAR1 DNA binding domain, Zinc finger, SWIM-type, MULE transposase domain, FHY3/FAR1 family [Artemisia annua]
MDLSRARLQLEFGDHVFIHRASLSNIGPQKAHKLRVALLGGFDKVHGMPVDWNNFHRGMNLFIGERDAQMLVDKMLKRQEQEDEEDEQDFDEDQEDESDEHADIDQDTEHDEDDQPESSSADE